MIDEVKRFDRTFAWVYARRSEDNVKCLARVQPRPPLGRGAGVAPHSGRPLCVASPAGLGLRIGDRDLPRQRRDQFRLGTQLQVQIEQDDEAEADPGVQDEVDAAADADQLGELRAVLGKPDEVEPRRRDRAGSEARTAGDRRYSVQAYSRIRGQQDERMS